jgi:2-dehydro-3-deoxyphosphooctonate aldolase (KDO 8-P synthase)
MTREISLQNFHIGEGQPLGIICGPCVIESRDHCLRIAESVAGWRDELRLPFVFKSSYDKANRTSAAGYRGLGLEQGLQVLQEVKDRFQLPVISDVHTEEESRTAAAVLDILQIPAFLCRQTSLLEAAGSTGKPVLIKKGQFLPPEDMRFAAEKVRAAGSRDILLCERGSCFGYRDLVVDMRGLALMRGIGYPVVFDATHSVQNMGGAGGKSSGNRSFVAPLARAAVAFGVDAVFLECHDSPDTAPSDGPNMLALDQVPPLIRDLRAIHDLRLTTRSR